MVDRDAIGAALFRILFFALWPFFAVMLMLWVLLCVVVAAVFCVVVWAYILVGELEKTVNGSWNFKIMRKP